MIKTTLELLHEKIEENKRLNNEMNTLYEQIIKDQKEEKKLWSVQQVASFFNVSTKTVKRGYESGKLPYRMILGTIRFDPEVVQQFGACL